MRTRLAFPPLYGATAPGANGILDRAAPNGIGSRWTPHPQATRARLLALFENATVVNLAIDTATPSTEYVGGAMQSVAVEAMDWAEIEWPVAGDSHSWDVEIETDGEVRVLLIQEIFEGQGP